MNLVENDWSTLSKNLLTSIFSSKILLPIEQDNNAGFRLEIKHMNTKRYLKELWTGKITDDLDKISEVEFANKVIIPAATRILVVPKDIF